MKSAARSPRPSPLIHDNHTVRQLAHASAEAWAALGRWRVQPPLVEEWERLEAALRRACRPHAALLVPSGEGPPVPSAAIFPSVLNASAHRLASAAFEARWFVARTQEAAQEDWLLGNAPVVFSPASWTPELEAALSHRGLTSEAPLPVPEEVAGLAAQAQGGAALLACLPHLQTLSRPFAFGGLLGTRGVAWLRAWLLWGVDAAVVSLAAEEEAQAARLRVFLSLREGLLSWGPYQPLAGYARECLASLGVPAHLQGEAPPLLTDRWVVPPRGGCPREAGRP